MLKTVLVALATLITAPILTTTQALAKPAVASHEQVVAVRVTSKGFSPGRIEVKAHRPVKLVVTRKTEQTCAKQIVLKDLGISKPLPLNQPVEIAFTPSKSGQIRYACGMDMVAGVIVVD